MEGIDGGRLSGFRVEAHGSANVGEGKVGIFGLRIYGWILAPLASSELIALLRPASRRV